MAKRQEYLIQPGDTAVIRVYENNRLIDSHYIDVQNPIKLLHRQLLQTTRFGNRCEILHFRAYATYCNISKTRRCVYIDWIK